METPAPSRPAAPAVVAVVVTRNAGPWFDEAVAALAAQDYSNLAVLYIDAASDADPTPRVAVALPGAYVRRLDTNPGFGAAANQVRDIVDGAAFFCFLHDDAAPEPDAIRTMVNEAVRSNAGIVGCKLVRLDDHRRLLQVGESVDKTGERSTVLEPGELDQEQYDAVRDVFVVPGGCTLVRADLFEAIGGFDEGIDLLNDDLSLCWRAHVAGARVVVAPDAVVGHAEALGERSDPSLRRQRLIRHRLRTMLTCYSRWHRVRVLPQAAVVAVLEVVYSVLVGRRGQARDVIAAWRWNWSRRDEIRERRAQVEAFRGVRDHEVRRFQVRGYSRFNAFLRGTGRGGNRSDQAQEAWQSLVVGIRAGTLRWPLAAWVVTLVIVGFGSRHLVMHPIAPVGGFLPFHESPRELFDAYLSGWRTTGLGSSAPAPTAFGLLALVGTVFLGAMGTLREVLLLGSILVGLIGAYRLLRPTGSPRAQAVALVVYGAIPLAYDAIAHARWGSLAAYAAMPWILAQLARASGWAPFGDIDGEAGPTVRPHRMVPRIAAVGLLVAVAAAVDPALVPVVAVVVLALAAGSLLAGSGRGTGRLLLAGTGGVAVAIVLHLPWALDFVLPGSSWSQVVGNAGVAETPTLGSLFRFDVGPVGASRLAYGFPIAATLPLLIGRGWRFSWAVRAWTVALALIGLTWAGGDDRLPLALPPAETMLVPAAACLALALALGVVAFEIDLRAYHFGWRQLASIVAGVALLLGALPTMLDAGNGRWYLPAGGLESTFGFLEADDPGFRVLWLGHPDVLPLPGHALALPDDQGDERAEHVVYATTDDGLPSLTDGWPASSEGPTELIEDALALAADGQTSRLGRLLAPMAIRYVVVPSASAPRPLGGVQRPASATVLDTLGDQLDLAALPVNPAYTVYRNEAALPTPALVGPRAGEGQAFEVTAQDLAGAEGVLPDHDGPTTRRGEVPAGGRILHSVAAADGWQLEIEGREAPSTRLFGWAQGFEPETSGQAVLRYDTDPLRYGVLAFQALFWLVAIRFARRARVRDEAGAAPVLAPPAPVTVNAPPPPERGDWLAPPEAWPADPTPALLDEIEADEPRPDPEGRP